MQPGPPDRPYDVAVVGAGLVGCAVARDLARHELDVALVEAEADVGTGTSKANTSLLHTGFDATPGSLEARLVRRGHERLRDYAAEVGIPLERTGALAVAWSEEQVEALDALGACARENGYDETRRLGPGELYELEPHLGAGARAALAVPDESIVCTFTTNLAFAYEAVENGVTLLLDSPVVGAARTPAGDHALALAGGRQLVARWLVNAAGLNADVVDELVLGRRRFEVRPRRGELIVFDKFARRLVEHILLPVPGTAGKGIVIAPTVLGNVLLGPTADDVPSRTDTDSTSPGIERLLRHGRRIVPALVDEEVTAVYAGLRAATDDPDFRIFADTGERYVCLGGIRSTGLTASLGIAEHVLELLGAAGLPLRARRDFRPVRMPNIGEAGLRPYRDPDAIARNADYGRIVCHCERVSLGELEDAAAAPVPARTLDGLRRRTRALMGRCQGFYCAARVAAALER